MTVDPARSSYMSAWVHVSGSEWQGDAANTNILDGVFVNVWATVLKSDGNVEDVQLLYSEGSDIHTVNWNEVCLADTSADVPEGCDADTSVDATTACPAPVGGACGAAPGWWAHHRHSCAPPGANPRGSQTALVWRVWFCQVRTRIPVFSVSLQKSTYSKEY